MRLLCTLLILTTFSITAYAGLLGTASVGNDLGIVPATAHQTRISMTFGLAGYPFDPSLFDDVVLTDASLGMVLSATSASDLDFAGIVAEMTDGEEDVLSFRCELGGGGGGVGDSEKNWFSLGTNDFAGMPINTITLTVDEISFLTEVDTTRVHLAYTVRVYDSPPLAVESSTWGNIKALFR